MENNRVTLRECVEVVKRFEKGEATQEDLKKLGDRINVRMYVPMLEKLSSIMRLLLQYEITDVDSTEIKFVEFYRNIFFYVELQLYAQIDLDGQADLINYETYDALYPIFHPFVKSYCEDDLKTYKEMVHDCISFNGIVDIANALGDIDFNNLKEQAESNAKLVESLKESKDLVKDLKEIYFANDSITKNLVKDIKDMAVREVMDSATAKMDTEERGSTEWKDLPL